MRKQQHSIDGFVPRRASAQTGNRHIGGGSGSNVPRRSEMASTITANAAAPRQPLGITRREIDDSLRGIDRDAHSVEKKSRGRRRRQSEIRPRRLQVRRIVKWFMLILLIVAAAYLGYVGVKALIAGGNIFKGNILGLLQSQSLKQDSNGRTNILILGTSEDDPGHQAGNLTDSMMILSVDQTKKDAYMISVPRDLYVKYGQACDAGYGGKINVYYSCVGGDTKNVDQNRSALADTDAFVGKIFGLNIQYGVNVNYTVMRDLVNAVGGITVTIDSRDPRGQMDSNFDWKCGATTWQRIKNCPPNGHYIDYPNGPVNLDAEHALYLAQARGDIAPTYGFEQSNFDREKNQQKILTAIRDKALSAGILTDFGKSTSIIDSLGNNLRTTFEANEVRTLVGLAKDIKNSDIHSISLIDGTNPVMGTGMVDGMSVVVPSAGTYDYTQLRGTLQKQLSSNPVTREGASITVLNASGVSGVAQDEADTLTKQGFLVDTVANAPDGTYGDIEVYQIGSGNPATKAKLEKILGVTVQTSTPPVTVADGTDFVVIVGSVPPAK